jgi:NAD(P)-dependent dehydrogenase (short-subunit alcohol dehydrogenase family)
MCVALASRNSEHLDPLVAELRSVTDCTAQAYGCDATNEISVRKLMALVSKDMGIPHLVIYAVQGFARGRAIEVEVPAFEESWRQNCLGAFIVAREAARKMLPLHRGTIIMTGSTSGLIGRAGHLNLAVGKFGLRALAQVMARELSPEGIHVAHLVIDADIKEPGQSVESAAEPQAYPEHVADLVLLLHRQQRSAWTSELDVRPWNESFWEHC